MLAWAGTGDAQSQASRPPVRTAPLLRIDRIIGPATAEFIVGELEAAGREGAPLVILQMDTPGGLDQSMRDIIRAILRSPVPVVSYVAPSGARAASAGTYIMYASHVAAMAPGTNLGAATPVAIGGGGGEDGGGNPFAPQPDKEKPAGDGKAPDNANGAAPPTGSAGEAKAVNDAVAYIRALAELRGRNVDWAEAAVRQAASLSATAALEQKVIDVVARDVDELLRLIHGRTVIATGNRITLDTQGLRLDAVEPGWRTRLLEAVGDPNIALIFMMFGIYGLLFEFMNPGALYPGVIGAICLIVGLYALAVLPLNYAGAALMLLGVALMTVEAFAPSFGVLGVGGLVAFVFGAMILVDTDLPQFRIALPVIVTVALAGLGLSMLIARLAVTSQRRQVVSGRESLTGTIGIVAEWSGTRGFVLAQGERWHATGSAGLRMGERVRVTGLDGLTLHVVPLSSPLAPNDPPRVQGRG